MKKDRVESRGRDLFALKTKMQHGGIVRPRWPVNMTGWEHSTPPVSSHEKQRAIICEVLSFSLASNDLQPGFLNGSTFVLHVPGENVMLLLH